MLRRSKVKPSEPTQPNVGPLSRQMAQAFSRDEFRELCLELHINPEEVPEDSLTEQCTWLIHTIQKENRLPELLALLTNERSHRVHSHFHANPITAASGKLAIFLNWFQRPDL
ncbi:MAG: hypothetical protein GY796_13115 [Chloroflexi bacterium]|nr:hypothetical protein [Chloroflexota bacterium]